MIWIDETFKHKKSEIIAYKESNSQEITIPKPVEQTKRDNNSNIELLDELFGNNNNQTPKPKENDLLNLFEDFPKYNKIPPNRSRSQQFLPKDDLFTTPAKSTNNDDLLILFLFLLLFVTILLVLFLFLFLICYLLHSYYFRNIFVFP